MSITEGTDYTQLNYIVNQTCNKIPRGCRIFATERRNSVHRGLHKSLKMVDQSAISIRYYEDMLNHIITSDVFRIKSGQSGSGLAWSGQPRVKPGQPISGSIEFSLIKYL